MVKMKSASVAVFLVSMILISSSFLQNAIADSSTTYAPSDCDSKCGVRCLNAGVKDRCLKYCGICCQQYSCVPSGTYGNKAESPCYRDKLNSKGTSKCP